MIAFFRPDNPIALIAALVVLMIIVKKLLSTTKVRNKSLPEAWVLPVTIVAVVFLAMSLSVLKIISYALPLSMIAMITIFFMILPFLLMGIESNKIISVLNFKTTTFYLKMLGIIILSFAASMVLGQNILESQTLNLSNQGIGFSILDAIIPAKTTSQLDLSFLFTTPALTAILLCSVLVLGLMTVTQVWIFKD